MLLFLLFPHCANKTDFPYRNSKDKVFKVI